jgi:hypothetical protein
MGHMTPHAVLLGLLGEDPENVEVGRLGRIWDEVDGVGEILLGTKGEGRRVKFDLGKDLVGLQSVPLFLNKLMRIDLALESSTCSSEWSAIHTIQQRRRYVSYKRVFQCRGRFRGWSIRKFATI